MTALKAEARELNKSALLVFFGHLGAVAGNLILLKLVAAYSEPEVFASFGLVLASVAAINGLAIGPLTQWVLRDFQHNVEIGRHSSFLQTVRDLVGVVGGLILLLAGVGSLLRTFLFEDLELSLQIADFLFAIAVYGLGVSLSELLSSFFNVSGHKAIAGVSYFTSAWARVAVLALFVSFAELTLRSLVFGLVMSVLVVLLFQGALLAKLTTDVDFFGTAEHGRQQKKAAVIYGMPFVAWAIPVYVLTAGDRWMLGMLASADELAGYVAMATVTFSLSNALTAAYNRAVVPYIFGSAGAGDEADRRADALAMVTKGALLLIATHLVLVLATYLFGKSLIAFFTSSKYESFGPSLWVLMAAATCFSTSQFIVTNGLVLRRSWMYVWAKTAVAVICILILYPAIKFFGVDGAIYAVLMCHAAHFLAIFLINQNLNKHA